MLGWSRALAWIAVIGLLAAGTIAGIVRDQRTYGAHDDVLTVVIGEIGTVAPLVNDKLHGSGATTVCEWASSDDLGLRLTYSDATSEFSVRPRVSLDPGRYVVRYSACRADSKEHAKVEVTVQAP